MTSRRDKKRRNSLSEHFFTAPEALAARGSIPSLPAVDPKVFGLLGDGIRQQFQTMTAEVASVSAGTRSLRGAPASSSLKLPRRCRRAAASPACMRWTQKWRLRGSSWHKTRTMQNSSTPKTRPLCRPYLFRWRNASQLF